jgi:hypothetical protein
MISKFLSARMSNCYAYVEKMLAEMLVDKSQRSTPNAESKQK